MAEETGTHTHSHEHAEAGSQIQSPASSAQVVSDYRGITAHFDNQYLRWNTVTEAATPVVVTYSFTNTPTTSEYRPYPVSSYWSYNATQQANFRSALAEFEAASGVMFVEVQGEAMINAFGADGASSGGWASLAFSTQTSTGDGYLVNASRNMAPGDYGYQVLLHELGHAMGLSHPHSGNTYVLDENADTQANTVMTYNLENGAATDLGPLDIAALRSIYGTTAGTAGWTVSTVNNIPVIIASDRSEVVMAAGQGSRVEAGRGDDTVYGREGNDLLFGGSGDDTISGGDGNDRVYGGSGDDLIYTDLEVYNTLGGHDSAAGGYGNDHIYLGYGNDRSTGQAGHDTLEGGYGNDSLNGSIGNDSLLGQQGDDRIFGGSGQDSIYGSVGNDTLNGHTDHDILFGESGNDVMLGGLGDDTLDGGSGDDVIFGNDGDDMITGGRGADGLRGLAGNDTLNGGDGADRMFGGAGADTFVFGNSDAFETNRIYDFEGGQDIIRIEGLNLRWEIMTLVETGNDGADASLQYSNWFRLDLLNTDVSELSETDFVFS
ncbi:type I secretion protein [Sulfitobacter sp. SK012]|uniref:M12 family metallo-peptidase n=1 Tax=Sulfitobacter sp. SK012 TaxID=1389005 RepID=UPI000E0AA1C5|nr:M12 family metallo-peptidase [Sulfitobacter sp. SK012]AXI48635.1 type I secretion protein [Sulfitobacter sp. SK012]